MIICVCRNIKSSQMEGKKLSRKKYLKILEGMQCETCKEEWEKYVEEDSEESSDTLKDEEDKS